MARASKKKAPTGPAEELRKRLVKLEATKDGFEGLIAKLVSAATLGQMRLMSSGDQNGIDSLSDPTNSAPRRAMQAKRYSPKTSFNLNTLLGEMMRANEAYADIDIWIMATTKAVNAKEAKDLLQHAHSLGWSFMALDWGEGAGLPRLAALCAAYPEITLAAMPGPDVQASIDAIAAHIAFEAVKDAVLNELRSQETGFQAAAKHSHARLNNLYADPALARAVAGPSPALLAEAPPVDRPALNARLQSWWHSGKRAAALLGDEGLGKTWQSLQFMRTLGTLPAAPLVVVIKSQTAENFTDAHDAVIAALVKMFESAYTKIAHPAFFWERRLRRWARSESRQIKVLVLIDGLDELDPFAWENWLAPLMSKETESLFRILLACRADDWQNRIAVAQTYGQDVEAVAIPKFEKPERDAYLSARGIDITFLSPKVLEAALHPRTAFHLTRLAKDLPDLTRVTREQLLLLDFRNRWTVKGGTVSPDAFRNLVQSMAQSAQDAALHQKAFSMTPGAVMDEIADITGYDKSKMRNVLSDLLSSSWCTRNADDTTKLEFKDESLPDAVGMALASEIIGRTVEAAEQHLDRFLEPWGADDILEPILRTCATALLINEKVSDPVCSMLLERWYRVPFHNDAGQDFWRRLHVFRPTLFLDFAEKNSRHQFNWLIEWGLACLWEDHLSARKEVEDRLKLWLVSAALPDYQHYPDPAAEIALNRHFRWAFVRAAVSEREGQGVSTATLSAATRLKESYLPVQAVRTMSFLPRAPFVPLIREWALAVATTGYGKRDDKLGALIRFNNHDHDALLQALRDCVSSLPGSIGLGVGRRAAAALLRLTGLEEDALLAEQILKPYREIQDGMLNIAGAEIEITATGLANPQFLLEALAPFAADASRQLSPTLRKTLKPLVARAIARSGYLGENGDAKLTIFRWFKDDLRAAVLGHLLAPPPLGQGDIEKRDMLRKVAGLALCGLEEGERFAVGENLAKAVEENGKGWPVTLAYQLSALPSSEQIALVLNTPLTHLPNDFGYLAKIPARADIEAVANGIDPNGTDDAIFFRLHLLNEIVERHEPKEANLTVDWANLFGRSDRTILVTALAVASVLDEKRAAASLRQMGWSAVGAADDIERFWGSSILASSSDADLPALLPKLQYDALLYLYDNRPALRPQLRDPILARFRDTLLTPRTSHSFGGRSIRYNGEDQFYATFYADHADAIDTMLKDAWSDKATRRNISLGFDPGIPWKLLRLTAERDPTFVAGVWTGSLEENRHSRMGDLEIFPARLGATAEAVTMRKTMLHRATTDADLFTTCIALQQFGYQEFLISEAKQCWLADRAVDKARALTIAGFLVESAEAAAFWGTLKRPTAGWLCKIYDTAYAHFQAGAQTRHWAGELSKSNNAAEVWSAYHLFLETVDDRAYAKPRVLDVPRHSWKESWLNFLQDQCDNARKKNQEVWKDSQLLSKKVNEIVYLE